MNTKNVMMSALLFLVISLVPLVNGGCRFNSAPKVEQVEIDKVKVSWDGVVANLGCLDDFVLNHWEKGTPKKYGNIERFNAKKFSTEIEVIPSQSYRLQLKTRKNRSWGESSIVEFKTDRDYDERKKEEKKDTDGDGIPDVLDTDDDNDRIPDVEDTDDDNNGVLDVDEKPPPSTMDIGIKYYIIASCGVIAGLIVIGIIYKLVCKCACNKKSSADPEKVYGLDENNDTLLNGSVHMGTTE